MINGPEFSKKQIVFAFLSAGEKVSFSNDNIVVKDCDGKIKLQATCYRLHIIFIIGNMTVTSGLLQKAHKFGFAVVLMTPYFKVYEFLGGCMEGNTLLRRKQYEYTGLSLGKRIIQNKVENYRKLLQQERGKSDEDLTAISKLLDYEDKIGCHEGLLQELLGLEGLAARTFFSRYYSGLDWHGRKPRIKPDYINSTLDIGYTMLFNFIDALLNIYGFDTYCGVLHTEFYMRKSLVCDLMEPFRFLIDKQVRKSVNLKQAKPEDFNVINGRYLLNWKKNQEYIGFLIRPILEHKMEIFSYIQAYYRSFIRQKPVNEYPWFSV